MFQVPAYPRQYHLAALRAEAEWLAAEAIQQEEDSLKARLYDIEQQRRYSRPPTVSRYGAFQTPFLSTPPHSPFEYEYPSRDPYYSQPTMSQRRHVLPSPSQDLEGLQAQLKEEHQARIAAEKELRRKVSELEQVQSRQVHPSAGRALAAQLAFHKPTATTTRLGCLKSAPPAAPSVNHPSQTSRSHDVEEILTSLFGIPHQGLFDQSTVKATPVPQEPACHDELPRAPIAPTNRPAAPETKPQNQINELFGALFGVPQQGTSAQSFSTIPDRPKPNTNAGPVTQTSAPKEDPAAPATPVPLNHPFNLGSLGKTLLGDLRARYNADHDDEVKDTVAAIIASLSDLSRTTEPAQSELSRKSSIEQLQARYHSEEDDESRDTLQATINSLNDTFGATTDVKAKGASLPSSDVLRSFQKVDNIEVTFHNLHATFAFPTQLDFVPTSAPSFTPTNVFSTLAFTARNHPVRFYEQSLLALLADLDLVESHGDTTLRTKRKEAVNQIEQALESLEQEIIGRWRSKVANEQTEGASSSRVLSPAEGVQGEAELESSKPQTKSRSVPILDASSSSLAQLSLDGTVEPEVAAEAVGHPTETDESDHIDASQLIVAPILPETSSARAEATIDVSGAFVDTEYKTNLSSASVSPSVSPSELPFGTINEDENSSALSQEEIDILNNTLSPSLSEPEEKDMNASKPSRKVEVEDLGSDWSDVDA